MKNNLMKVFLIFLLICSSGISGNSEELTNDEYTQYLSESMECQFTSELAELASQLNNDPVNIFNWVYNNVEFEDYEGSRKGAQSTYFTGLGNEWDQSSLLVTLLRLSGIPARYVHVGNLDQVYVEAYVSSDSYRGIGDNIQKNWFPLVPWVKDYKISQGIDLFPDEIIPSELDFDFDDYVSSVKQKQALELFEEMLQSYLNKYHPGKSIKDIPYKKDIKKQSISIIPNDVPKSIHSLSRKKIYAEIPNSNRVQSKIVIFKGSTDSRLLEKVVYLPEIASSRLILDFIPASNQDKQVISNYGGMCKTPEGVANIKPVLRLNGDIIEYGASLETGERFRYAYMKSGEIEKRPAQQAGTIMAIAMDGINISSKLIDSWKQSLNSIPVDYVYSDENREKYLGLYMNILAGNYLLRYIQDKKRAKELVRVTENLPKSAFFNVLVYTFPRDVKTNAKVKYLIHPSMSIDAGVSSGSTYRLGVSNSEVIPYNSTFGRFARYLAAYGSSYNEGMIFEDWQDTKGGNAVKAIMVAHEQGIPVHTLTSGDVIDGNIPIIENQVQDRLSDHIIDLIKEALSDPETIVKLPVKKVIYGGMVMSAYLRFTPTSSGFMFNMNNGGGSADEVAEDVDYDTDWDYDSFFDSEDNNELCPSCDDFAGDWDIEDWDDTDWEDTDWEDSEFYETGWENDDWEDSDWDGTDYGSAETVEAVIEPDGDPVDLVKGQFYQIELPDFALKSRGPGLDINRKYKSQSSYNGPFGFGWTWNHMERILFSADGNLLYFNSNGVPYYIEPLEGGGYSYPPGTTFTLSKSGSNYIITNKDNSKYTFTEEGFILRKEDITGNFLKFEYDQIKNLSSISDILGRSLYFSYNSNNKIEKVTDFMGRYCKYEYDGEDLVAFTDLEGNTTRYEYLKNQDNPANNHNMSKYILPTGDYLEIGYYKNDQVSHHTNKKGETFSFQYSRLNRYAETWNESGYYKKVFYNDRNDVIRITTRDKTVKTKKWDDNHNLVEETDGNGNKLAYTYDENRNLITKTNSLNETWTYEYDLRFNKKSKITDPMGHVTRFEYDGHGNLIKKTDAKSNETAYEYDQFGNNIKIIDPLGNDLEKTYDGFGWNLIRQKDWNGNETSYVYNNIGNRISETDPQGYTTRYEYNGYNQLIKKIDALDGVTIYEYDSIRKLSKKIEPNGAITEYLYDTARDIVTGANVVQIIDPLGKSRHFEYDETGNKILEITENGDKYRYDYDELNRITAKTDPLNHTVHFEYDGNGNLTSEETDRGDTLIRKQFDYDAANRIVKKTDPEGNSVFYEYNASGKQILKTQYVTLELGEAPTPAKTSYNYDSLNNLVSKTIGVSSSAPRVYTWQYDNLGRVVKEINPLGHEVEITYDANGNKTSKSWTQNNTLRTETYVYDNRNLLASKTDANGNTYLFEYDGLKRKLKEIDPQGNIVQYFYDSVGNLVQLKDQLGNITEYAYNLNKKRIRSTNVLGYSKQFNYDDNSNLVRVIDEDGYETKFYYDSLDRRIGIENALGATITIDYDEIGNKINQTDALGHSIKYEYDKNSNLIKNISTVDSRSIVSLFTYNEVNKPLKTTDAKGNSKKVAYSIFNEPVKETNALNQSSYNEYDNLGRLRTFRDQKDIETVFEYNEIGKITSVTQAKGTVNENTTNYQYDGNGNKIKEIRHLNNRQIITNFGYDSMSRLVSETKVIDPKMINRTFSYDARGALVKNKDAMGNETHFVYDDLGRKIKAIDPEGNSTVWQYDRRGNIVMISKPEGEVITYVYDGLNRKVKEIMNGAEQKFQYDKNNRVVETVNFVKVPTTYSYDELGRLISKTEARNTIDEATTSYAYDDVNNLVAITNAKQATVKYEYDQLKRRIKEFDADKTFKTAEYDESGNLKRYIKRDGTVVDYQFDSLYRVVGVLVDGQLEQTFGYDDLSRMVSATDSNGGRDTHLTQWEYDDLNRVAREIQDGKRLDKVFDDNSNVTQMIYPSGVKINKSYTTRNQPNQIWDETGIIASFEYDGNGRQVKLNLGNGIDQITEYDARSLEKYREYKHGVNGIYSLQTEYDHQGNIVKEVETDEVTSTVYKYKYDNQNRLVKDQTNNDIWLYDLVGNWTYTNFNGSRTQFTSNNDNEYLMTSSASISYDDNGNLISDGKYHYVFDWKNRLVEVSQGGNPVASYTYDARNRRISKNISGASKMITYVYDENRVIEEYLNDSLERYFTYGPYIDDPLIMQSQSNRYYYLKDRKYSIKAITDENGNVVEKYKYSAFGNMQVFNNNGQLVENSQISNPYGFTGRRFDDETGLWFYRNRMYSSTLGRFLQRDPKGYVDGMNLYAYVKNNPIKFTDPMGLQSIWQYKLIDSGEPIQPVAQITIDSDKGVLTAEAGVLAGRQPVSFDTPLGQVDANLDAKVVHAEVKVGMQWEASARLASIGLSNDNYSNEIKMDVMSVKAGFGTVNSDGSRGFNVSLAGTIIGVEGTYTPPDAPFSVTGGLAASVKGEASIGIRDIDLDENPEICIRISAYAYTAGGCFEF